MSSHESPLSSVPSPAEQAHLTEEEQMVQQMGLHVEGLRAAEAAGTLKQDDVDEIHDWAERIVVSKHVTPGYSLGGGVEIPDTIERTYGFEWGDAQKSSDVKQMDGKVAESLLDFAEKHAKSAKPAATEPEKKPVKHNRQGRRIATRPQGAPGKHESGKSVESQTDGEGDISDIVNVDTKGRGHVSGSHNPEGRSRNGQFISSEQMAMISEHQGLIRDGLAGRNNPGGQPPVEPTPPIHPPVGPEPVPAPGGGPRGPEMTGEEFIDGDYMRELPLGMAQELATALNDYTKLAAARSQATLHGGKVVLTPKYKTRGGQPVRDEHGDIVMKEYVVKATAENVEAARRRYEALRRQAKFWTINKMAEKQVPIADQKLISYLEDKTEIKLAGLGIKFDQERLADPKGFMAGARRKFYDWWARQGRDGKLISTGTVKKAAVIAVVGLPIGVAAGAAGAFIAGPLAGGAVAAAMARGVSRGLLRGKIEKSAHAKTVAKEQYEQHQAAQLRQLKAQYREGRVVRSVTNEYSDGVEQNVKRNRRRMVGSAAIGAASGLGGAFVGEAIHHAVWGSHHSAGQAPKKPTIPPKPHTGAGTPPAAVHGTTGQEFRVEQGSGEIREIQEYAASHNYHITPQQADEIYNQLYAEHGAKIIDLDGSGPDTYQISPGNVGLSHPGMAHWYPGIEDELRARLEKTAA